VCNFLLSFQYYELKIKHIRFTIILPGKAFLLWAGDRIILKKLFPDKINVSAGEKRRRIRTGPNVEEVSAK
jgi:hypothetical protein